MRSKCVYVCVMREEERDMHEMKQEKEEQRKDPWTGKSVDGQGEGGSERERDR